MLDYNMSENQSKNIMEKRVDVYLNSPEQKERWKEKADEKDLSLSKFVQFAVEEYISNEEIGEPNKAQKIAQLENEVQSLTQENERLERVIDTYKDELQEYKKMQFSDKDKSGKRNYSPKLVEKIREDSPVNEDEILRHLNISPSDGDNVSWVSSQLELLAEYGLVEYTGDGWRWKDE